MNRMKILCLAVIGMIAFGGYLVWCSDISAENSMQGILGQQINVRNMNLMGSDWSGVFVRVCETVGVACGIEESPHDLFARTDEKVGYYIEPATITVRQFMEKMVLLHPAYQWRYSEEVLEMFPKAGHEYRFFGEAALERIMKQVNIVGRTPEIAAREVGVQGGVVSGPIANWSPGFRRIVKTAPPKIDVRMNKVTLRQVLNRIVKSDSRVGIWKFYCDARHADVGCKIDYSTVREWRH